MTDLSRNQNVSNLKPYYRSDLEEAESRTVIFLLLISLALMKAHSDRASARYLDTNPWLNLAFTVGLVAAVPLLLQSNLHLENAGRSKLGFSYRRPLHNICSLVL